jgi:hypothetical protein
MREREYERDEDRKKGNERALEIDFKSSKKNAHTRISFER